MTDITIDSVAQFLQRVGTVLSEHQQHLTDLDQEIGDGDMGITMGKIAVVFETLAADIPEKDDLGKFLVATGMAANRVASSTMGTLVATGFMRAGKELRGTTSINQVQLADALIAAVRGMQDRGKAKLGDKTIIDALHPAALAFRDEAAKGGDNDAAMQSAAAAARTGRDEVTPLRSKIGRAGWVGERTEGKVDPGCEMAALVLTALN